ncbi:hypothetical protein LBMAG21_03120 [Armatimonadota bacterium]|nr:hypothetical protein LBMAG21_03120 [Armatimonadota bacterium]
MGPEPISELEESSSILPCSGSSTTEDGFSVSKYGFSVMKWGVVEAGLATTALWVVRACGGVVEAVFCALGVVGWVSASF